MENDNAKLKNNRESDTKNFIFDFCILIFKF